MEIELGDELIELLEWLRDDGGAVDATKREHMRAVSKAILLQNRARIFNSKLVHLKEYMKREFGDSGCMGIGCSTCLFKQGSCNFREFRTLIGAIQL